METILLKTFRLALVWILMVVIQSNLLFSQQISIGLANLVATSTTVEFNIVIQNTGSGTIGLGGFGGGLQYSTAIGGTMATGNNTSFTIVSQPSANGFPTLPNFGPNANHTNTASVPRHIRWTHAPSPGVYATLSPSSPTILGRFKLTSSTPWTQTPTVSDFTLAPIASGFSSPQAVIVHNGSTIAQTLTLAASGIVPLITCPSALTYLNMSSGYCLNSPITPNTNTVVGTLPITYSVAPALPTGLSLNTTTGTISGTGTVATAAQNYVVTATNSCGNTTATLNIGVGPIINPITSPTNEFNVLLGNTLQLSSTTSGGTWSSSNTTAAPISPTGLVSGNNIGTTTISYTVTDVNSCVNTLTKTVSVVSGNLIDIGIFNEPANSDNLVIKIRPSLNLVNASYDAGVFTVRFPSSLGTTLSVLSSTPYGYGFVSPVGSSGGFDYYRYSYVAGGTPPPLNLTGGQEFTIATLQHSGGCTGNGTFEIASDAYTTSINGDFYQEMDAADQTGSIYQSSAVSRMDQTIPTITCPTDVTVNCTANIPTPFATATLFNAGGGSAMDNCTAVASLTLSSANGANTGNINCNYSFVRTYTATDASTNSNTCTQTISVAPPVAVITAPANITVACGAIPAASTQPFSNAVNGGCLTGTSNASTFSAPPTFCGGPVTETWTATDVCSRTLTPVTRTITVSPATLPVLATQTNTIVSCGTAMTPTTIAYTNGLSGACLISGTSNNSTFSAQSPAGVCGGNITQTWTATDLCARPLVNRTRIITVTAAPQPTMTAPANITVACGTALTTSTLPFTNGLSGGCLISGTSNTSTLSATPNACGGTVTETWTATDICGRTLEAVSRTITISPALLPTLSTPANITVACGAIPTPSTRTYTNGLTGGCLVSGTSTTSTFTAAPSACGGTVTETWNATDGCGRALAPVSRTITVNPATLPTMTAPANITVACGAIPAPSTRPYTNGLSGGCAISGTSDASTFSATPPACGGTVTETWTATDVCGRTIASVSRTITVTPAAVPTMTSPGDITVACGAIPATSTLPYSNGLTGGCEISGTSNTSTFTVTPGACGGTVTETWTSADDACGRPIASVSRTITVSPAALPTMTAPSNVTVTCQDLVPMTSTLPFTNGLSGGCLIDGTSVTSTFSTIPNSCNQTITETWTATDGCSRPLVPVTRTILVNDDVLPAITAPASITVTVNNAGCTAIGVVLGTATGVSDNCTTPNVTNNGLTTYPLGNTTVVWTATDGCGNTQTSNQVVTVETSLAATSTNLANTAICTGQSTDLSFTITGGSSPYNVVYSRTPGTNVTVSGYTNGQLISVNPTAPGGMSISYEYAIVSVTDALGCVINPMGITNTLTVNPLPSAINGTSTSCANEAVGFDLQAYMNSSGNGVNSNFSWFALSDNPLVTGESLTSQTGDLLTDVLVNNTILPQAVVYRVTPMSDPAGCTGSTFDITITVYNKPDAAAADKTICSGTLTALSVTNPNGVFGAKFNWSATYGAVTGGAGSAMNVSFGATAINETLVNPTTSSIVVSYVITPVVNNCPGPQITVNVTVVPTVGMPVVSGPIAVCQNDPNTMYSATSTNNTGITYSMTPALAGTINSSTGEVDWNAAYSGSATISAVATGCNGSTETGTLSVTVNPLPNLNITQPAPVCANLDLNTVVLNPSISGGTVSFHSTLMNAETNTSPLVGLAVTEANTNTFVRYTLPTGCYAVSSIVVQTGACVTVTAKAFLQGPYNTTTGLMNDNLRNLSLIPTSDVYGTAPFVHVNNPGAPQTTTSGVLAVTGNDAIVDWVFVELRSKANRSMVVATRSALIQRDGDVVDMDGTSNVLFNTVNKDSFFVAVRHRNHLATVTNGLVDYKPMVQPSIDFTSPSTIVLGTNGRRQLAPGILGMWSGNASLVNLSAGKGVINYNGSNNDRQAILNRLGGNALGTLNGYFGEDVNMDGVVKNNGSNNDRQAILSNLGGNQLGSIIEQLIP
jgi:sarcosine oxidase delta subunit